MKNSLAQLSDKVWVDQVLSQAGQFVRSLDRIAVPQVSTAAAVSKADHQIIRPLVQVRTQLRRAVSEQATQELL